MGNFPHADVDEYDDNAFTGDLTIRVRSFSACCKAQIPKDYSVTVLSTSAHNGNFEVWRDVKNSDEHEEVVCSSAGAGACTPDDP